MHAELRGRERDRHYERAACRELERLVGGGSLDHRWTTATEITNHSNLFTDAVA
jgi:hypothetical protein